MLKIKPNKMRFFFSVINCVKRKSILSIIQQNPVKAKDSSQQNIQTLEDHKDFSSKNAFECDSLHMQSQSLAKKDQFKKEYSFLGEGQKLS